MYIIIYTDSSVVMPGGGRGGPEGSQLTQLKSMTFVIWRGGTNHVILRVWVLLQLECSGWNWQLT